MNQIEIKDGKRYAYRLFSFDPGGFALNDLNRENDVFRFPVGRVVDLIGYTTWGCLDLVSAGTGEIRKRYGFIYVDVDDFGNGTYKRYRKDSFYWYQKCCRTNGEDLT